MYTSIEGIEVAESENLSKQDFRTKVWDYLQSNKLVRFPLPVYNRIPNFIGGSESGIKVSELPEFISAQTIKINPDKPQEEVRFLTLQSGKKLLVPTPRLRTGLFNLLEKDENDDSKILRFKAQSEGLKMHSTVIDLQSTINVDLIVLGSVAVSRTGRRIGKGEGFADLEYAMMKTVKAIDDSIKIVTTVHDCQVFNDLPERIFQDYDVPVDIIVTPTQVIEVEKTLKRPQGIYWNLLTVQKFLQVPVLRSLYESEKENGNEITFAEGVTPPDLEEIEKYQETIQNRGGRGGGRGYPRRGGRFGRPFRGRFRYDNRHGNEDEEGHAVESGEEGDGQQRRKGTREFRRGRGRARVNRGDSEEEHAEDEGSPNARFGNGRRRRPQGRRNMRYRYGDDGGPTRQTDVEAANGEDPNIQVTINVSKQNKIVKRRVETTDQKDRIGSTDPDGENYSKYRVKRNSPPSFSLFVGGIPRFCRPYDLKTELSNHGVRPAYITWRGSSGFAFLNFNEEKFKEDEILLALEGLTIKNRNLTVDRARGRVNHENESKDVNTNGDVEAHSSSHDETSSPNGERNEIEEPDTMSTPPEYSVENGDTERLIKTEI